MQVKHEQTKQYKAMQIKQTTTKKLKLLSYKNIKYHEKY